jgi:glutamyl-tRNA synthetase
VRSDGHPLYHFTVCVDDVAMGITHVVRGVDHLPNAPKHVALFRALDAPCPVFAHLGMILGADGKKLSKRHGAAGVEEFRDQGFLPEALVNFLALLGWSPGEDRERMTLSEMTALFALERIGPSPSRFDHEKLQWMNGQVIQETPDARLLELLVPFGLPARDAKTLARGIALLRPRAKTLIELAQGLAVYGDDAVRFDEAGMKKWGRPEFAPVLRALAARLDAVEPFAHAGMEEAARALAAETGVPLGQIAQPARLALTGSLASPPLFEMIEVLGRETARRRILAFADRIAAPAAVN